MERKLWKSIMALFHTVSNGRGSVRLTHKLEMIVRVWFWSVVNDRPVSWSCRSENWAIWDRRNPLPSNATMSRRLRSKDVQKALADMEERILRPDQNENMVWMIDGKPLVISGCSKDRQAGYGRATGGKGKGYKIHVIAVSNGSVADWRLAPMNKDERVMAGRMLNNATISGYLLADGNYDSNKLHAKADKLGNLQIVCPRRGSPGKGLGNRKQTDGRPRSKEILENPFPEFGEQLMLARVEIERFFGNLTNWGGGLTCLPAWARTYRRVHRWVQAKLIANAARRATEITTYDA